MMLAVVGVVNDTHLVEVEMMMFPVAALWAALDNCEKIVMAPYSSGSVSVSVPSAALQTYSNHHYLMYLVCPKNHQTHYVLKDVDKSELIYL